MPPYERWLQAFAIFLCTPEHKQVKLQAKRGGSVHIKICCNFFPLFLSLFGVKNFELIICDLHWPGWLFWNQKEGKASPRETGLVPFSSPPSHYFCPNLNKVRLGLQDESASTRPKSLVSARPLFQMLCVTGKSIALFFKAQLWHIYLSFHMVEPQMLNTSFLMQKKSKSGSGYV